MCAFIHHTRLDHLLRPQDYSSHEFWQAEMSHLFQQSWQYAGQAEDLARPGSYFARDIAGVPVVVRNFDGELRAFRNICPHRHTMMVGEGSGCTARLKCMYHGWEFGSEGQVTHLPDGPSFRGVRMDEHKLCPVRLERLGSMLFVNLSPNGPSMREGLTSLVPELDQYFGNHTFIWRWVTEHPVNWKIIEENAVESYHVPMTHPGTYGQYKAPELHDHQLEPGYTRYADLEPWKNSIVGRGFRLLSKLFLPRPNYERFKHAHLFPNNLLYYNELLSTWAFLQPLSPGRTRYELLAFIPRNVRGGSISRLALRLLVQPLVRQFARILKEDMDLWPRIHHGLAHSPHHGVLSCREERVHAFQKYVVEGMKDKRLPDTRQKT